MIAGTSSSGVSETQIFCYDEQNRLVWAGTSGTVPSAGNGTCGSGTPSTNQSRADYRKSYSYTHLGQLWQISDGIANTQSQYLYCDSSHPHQLTGVYTPPSGQSSTCSNKGTATYTSSYSDASNNNWGDVQQRSVGSTSATLSYDNLDHLVQWNSGSASTGQEWYLYDSSGERVLRRSISGNSTTYTVYAFGMEEHTYGAQGVNQQNIYYYILGERLLGELKGTNTLFFIVDALGSVMANFNRATATVQGNELYDPYGNVRNSPGTQGTAKGFTGQYSDGLTGLDYYNARYYDPVVGRFLSADTVQGNMQGMDPYAYVGGNPETYSDPTGMWWGWHRALHAYHGGGRDKYRREHREGEYWHLLRSSGDGWHHWSVFGNFTLHDAFRFFKGVIDAVTGIFSMMHEWHTMMNPKKGWFDRVKAGIAFGINLAMDLSMAGEALHGAVDLIRGGEDVVRAGEEVWRGGEEVVREEEDLARVGEGEPCSFTSTTQVTTDHGKQQIGKLHVGDKVLAYNPKTQKIEVEPILHVWIHPDNDLIDLTITTTTQIHRGTSVTHKSELIHTTSKHPFLTTEQGFVPAGQLHMGMHVLRADGRVGIIIGWKVVPGTMLMYNLEVAHDHTFTVGDGQWVVHNSCGEQINHNPDAKTAFENVQKNLGRPLSDDAVRSTAKWGDAAGLDNGMREGFRFGWRLEWDSTKGAHFNWFDWTAGDKSSGRGRWGTETFTASEDEVTDMILKFSLGGVREMLS